jgi:hypothetical protein
VSSAPRRNSPETRGRADARLRRLTRVAALLATGATVAIGVVVAKEHPGASATSPTVPAQNPTAPSTTKTRGPSPGAVSPPSRTRSHPVVTSGGTSR